MATSDSDSTQRESIAEAAAGQAVALVAETNAGGTGRFQAIVASGWAPPVV
jgi:hypothetical protein